jgi:DNA-binding CsgD family transcriptional regulator
VVATAAAARERARADIARLVHRGLDLPGFARAAARIVERVVPFEGTCLLTIDPATMLPTGEVVEHGLPAAAMVRLTEIELGEPDVNTFVALARCRRPAASLSGATTGDLDRSLRQRELRRPSGFEDELRAVLPDEAGAWGALTLLREAHRSHFTPAEVRFVASLAGPLAEGVRRATLMGAAPGPGSGAVGPGDRAETGVLVLAPDGSLEMADQAAASWLDELGTGGPPAGLPTVIRGIAARARQIVIGPSLPDDSTDEGDGGTARARVRTEAGRWLVVRGSLLGDGPDARVAVLLEEARAPELAPLVADAFGFTDRERRVTELVAQGHSTNEIADRLHLSAYTVQDHLKAIFDKSGTGTRGELVARLLFDHYAPRLTPGP